MKHLFYILLAITVFFSCKKDNVDKDTITNITDSTITVNNDLVISINGKKTYSFDSTFTSGTDSVEITFTAKGKDYRLEYLGETIVKYCEWDSTVALCSYIDPFAFSISGENTFTIKNGETLTKKVYFNPKSFDYSLWNGFTQQCFNGECNPIPNCQSQSSNGVGLYKSLLSFRYTTSKSISIPVEGYGKQASEGKEIVVIMSQAK